MLDIGCRWGGLALYLNRVAGVELLGVTLSEEQFKVANQRAAGDAGRDRRLDREMDFPRRLFTQLERNHHRARRGVADRNRRRIASAALRL